MNIKRGIFLTLNTAFVSSLLVSGFIFFAKEKQLHAQHSGGGIIDPSRQPGKKSESYHQSFAPYGGTVPIPWIDEKPETTTIKVTDVIVYEIPVDKKKLDEGKITTHDLELEEVEDSAEINFHQVDCYFFKVIKQKQIRKTENLVCTRERDGTQYWLSDGKKYIEWGRWSNWKQKDPEDIELVGNKP